MSSHQRRLPIPAPEVVFLVWALLLGGALALFVPPGAGYDEPSHIARVDQLAQGHLFAHPIDDGFDSNAPGGRISTPHEQDASASAVHPIDPDDVLYGDTIDVALMTVAMRHLNVQSANSDRQHIYAFPAWADAYSKADLAYGSLGRDDVVFSNSAQYTPLVYVPHLVGFAFARILHLSAYWTIVAMRLAGLLLFVLGMFLCIRTMPFGKWLVAAVACAPGTMIVVSMVSPDTVTLLVCAALLSKVLQLGCAQRALAAHDMLLLALFVVALAFVKMSYYPVALLLALIPLLSPPARTPRTIGGLVGLFVAGLGLFLLWFMAVRHINSGAMWGVDNDPSGQVAYLLSHPLEFLSSVAITLPQIDIWGVRSTGFFVNSFPEEMRGMVTIGWWGVLLLLLASIARDSRESTQGPTNGALVASGMVALGVFSIVVLLIFAALAIGFTPVGAERVHGLQYRYFIPISLLPVLAIPLIRSRSGRDVSRYSTALAWVVVGMMVTSGLWEIILLYMGVYR